MDTVNNSEFVRHISCPNCGSSDANSLYSDNHTYCFSCGSYGNMDDTGHKQQSKVNWNMEELVESIPQALPKRKITQATCGKWGYGVGSYKGKPVQVANYQNKDGEVVAQKLRFPDKTFSIVGSLKDALLYGEWLWRDGGKMVTVVEGEVDALSLSQVFDNKWPVVSIPNGAQAAKKAVAKSIEWLSKFESVIFMFDMDTQGQKAARECATILPPNKAKIATLPLKDANEMLQAGRVKELVSAVWDAKVVRPDGIVSGEDLWDVVSCDDEVDSCSYPYTELQEKTQGIRKGEIVTVTAGSGIGKSQFSREIAHSLLKQGETIGYIALEESVKRTALGLMSIEANTPLHINREGVSEEKLKEAFDATVGSGRVYLYDHWGSTDSDNLISKIRFLARGCGCSYIILDHISIIVSGIDGGDERRIIDNTMTNLRGLVEELKCGMLLVSHLKRPQGERGHEEGATTSLAQLRGSAAIGQLSDVVIGLERNQQDVEHSNETKIRVLKNRWTGDTGLCGSLYYDKTTGRMTEDSIITSDLF